jgi:SprT-like family
VNVDRDQWLAAALGYLAEEYGAALADTVGPVDLGVIRATCGWPKRERDGKVMGQCYRSAASPDGARHIFITPRIDDPVLVLATLLHELIHAADDCVSGHRGPFVKAARTVGLVGKPTETYAEAGSALHAELRGIAAELGPYPRAPEPLASRAPVA